MFSYTLSTLVFCNAVNSYKVSTFSDLSWFEGTPLGDCFNNKLLLLLTTSGTGSWQPFETIVNYICYSKYFKDNQLKQTFLLQHIYWINKKHWVDVFFKWTIIQNDIYIMKKQIVHLLNNFTAFSRQYKCKERQGHLFYNNIKIK